MENKNDPMVITLIFEYFYMMKVVFDEFGGWGNEQWKKNKQKLVRWCFEKLKEGPISDYQTAQYLDTLDDYRCIREICRSLEMELPAEIKTMYSMISDPYEGPEDHYKPTDKPIDNKQ